MGRRGIRRAGSVQLSAEDLGMIKRLDVVGGDGLEPPTLSV